MAKEHARRSHTQLGGKLGPLTYYLYLVLIITTPARKSRQTKSSQSVWKRKHRWHEHAGDDSAGSQCHLPGRGDRHD